MVKRHWQESTGELRTAATLLTSTKHKISPILAFDNIVAMMMQRHPVTKVSPARIRRIAVLHSRGYARRFHIKAAMNTRSDKK